MVKEKIINKLKENKSYSDDSNYIINNTIEEITLSELSIPRDDNEAILIDYKFKYSGSNILGLNCEFKIYVNNEVCKTASSMIGDKNAITGINTYFEGGFIIDLGKPSCRYRFTFNDRRSSWNSSLPKNYFC